MKVELKHLAPYLPYGLTVWHPETGNAALIVFGLNIPLNKIINGVGNSTLSIDDIKPILRPYSDVIITIDHNNKKILVAKQLWSVDDKDEYNYEVFGTIPGYWKLCLQQKPTDLDYHDVRILFEHNIDVFGLIEKGLAIDINTLKK